MVPNDLQAVSIEFAFFTDYAGNKSQPNEFSRNLLENFEKITGKQPTVRVGGTSQYASSVLLVLCWASNTDGL
jgi:hypothetical protein